jgi:energy-coupling factor transport system substrate-specific component
MSDTRQIPLSANSVRLALAILCIAVNVGVGSLVHLVKAPVYLDAIGTIAFAFLYRGTGWQGFVWAAAVGAISFLLVGLILNPVAIWFVPVQVAIAAYAYYLAGPLLGAELESSKIRLAGYVRIVLLGLGLGLVAGIISAPIIAYVFGGLTGAGASLITAFLLKAGETLFTSVLASGLASEPLDKLLQLGLAVVLVHSTPRRVRATARTG